ncbi:MAG: hypothetical protein A2Z04_05900 [Chloroflexi bacterium RBG_16_57_9]|nr:MAG: hypothetical protein A2Z04_05900 [Chloroflexi bacterium RBG_16_57_9]
MSRKRVLAGIALLALLVLSCNLLTESAPPSVGQSAAPTAPGARGALDNQPTIASQSRAVPTLSSAAPGGVPPLLQGGMSDEQRLIELYKKVSPSVVFIGVQMVGGVASGSGFIIDQAGDIVTNNHVVEGARQIVVDFYDNSRTEATVVGTDPDSDLAVIRAKALPPGATPVVLGDSNTVQVGQMAIAIGNPFGRDFALTMTTGIISAKARSLPAGEISGVGMSFQNPEILQTDAAINPGNSGGPLFNSRGEVIGVNAAIQSRSGTNSGVGFAIPVNTIKRIAPELMRNGRYAHPYLGIAAQPAAMLPARENPNLLIEGGAQVDQITPGGPASQSELRVGDILKGINGTPIRDFNELIIYLESNTRPGDTINLTINRGNRDQIVRVRVGERPGSR